MKICEILTNLKYGSENSDYGELIDVSRIISIVKCVKRDLIP
jgi:hypothetical protein